MYLYNLSIYTCSNIVYIYIAMENFKIAKHGKLYYYISLRLLNLIKISQNVLIFTS